MEQGGRKLSLLLFDTEGFESTGKADAYDDRIFALSALLSAVLIYNLPETVRESDIEKLSFAVQLADGFYANAEVTHPAPCQYFRACHAVQPVAPAQLSRRRTACASILTHAHPGSQV